MESGEDSYGSSSMKRPREPLSDTEDNVLLPPAVKDGQKRRRLECGGQENRSPAASASRRPAEDAAPDTPALPSILDRGRPFLAQRCLSDPGFCDRLTPDGAFRQGLLGGEFRVQGPSPDPANPCPRTLSNFVSGIQQKLQGSATLSSKKASHIRQEREQELRLLCSQSINDNAWLKRSFSDPSLAEGENGTDDVEAESSPEMKDGSFIEPSTSRIKLQVERSGGEFRVQGPSPDPANPCPPTLSNFVSGIQQKLQGSATLSSKKASHIRQEREQELRLLCSQPINDNAWLKRSYSDPLAEGKNGTGHVEAESSPEMKDGSFTEPSTSRIKLQAKHSEAEPCSAHNETNTAEMIDRMFGEVLEYAEEMEEEEEEAKRGDGDHDSSIATRSVDQERTDTESKMEEGEEEEEFGVGGGEEELFPPIEILSPLSKSVEAVLIPLSLAINPSLQLTPEEALATPTSDATDSAPLYSIDAYRTQRQRKLPIAQTVTPVAQRRAQDKSRPQTSTKEKVSAPGEATKQTALARTKQALHEAGTLQIVMTQTLQALSCCTDEDHGRGSLEEVEAEKLLLVASVKRQALLAEVARLKEEQGLAPMEAPVTSQQPCRGTVAIGNVQLPLKVEFVCSSRNRKGRPSHYFFVLIRYGPCNIVATPLATAADAQSGDTISFPTAVTLKDIRSNFEIDVEVYSLSTTTGNNCNIERSATKTQVTPRKLLSTITHRSNNSMAPAALPMSLQRSSNFCLVGSHKITLASLGQSKFPLDKIKFEGKIRKLLGDEFQKKVPFLSPLEGNIYLRLDSQGHSSVQHQGFLTMFEVLKGFGIWHRRYVVLEGYRMSYWNHPNDRECKPAEGSISLSSNQSVECVKRDSCARPFTFELVSGVQALQQESENATAKCWFSADTKEDRADWMDNLTQVLLDLRTWCPPPPTHTDAQQATTSSTNTSI